MRPRELLGWAQLGLTSVGNAAFAVVGSLTHFGVTIHGVRSRPALLGPLVGVPTDFFGFYVPRGLRT